MLMKGTKRERLTLSRLKGLRIRCGMRGEVDGPAGAADSILFV